MDGQMAWHELIEDLELIYVGLLIPNFKTNLFKQQRILIPLLKNDDTNSIEFKHFSKFYFSKDRCIEYSKIFLQNYFGKGSQSPSYLPFLYLKDTAKEIPCKFILADIFKRKLLYCKFDLLNAFYYANEQFHLGFTFYNDAKTIYNSLFTLSQTNEQETCIVKLTDVLTNFHIFANGNIFIPNSPIQKGVIINESDKNSFTPKKLDSPEEPKISPPNKKKRKKITSTTEEPFDLEENIDGILIQQEKETMEEDEDELPLITQLERLNLKNKSNKDIVSKIKKLVLNAKDQKLFRTHVLQQFSGKCVVTGCEIEELLEAALIIPSKEGGYNTSNGLCLRSDFCLTFNKYLWSINPQTMQIEMQEKLLKYEEYKLFNNKKIECSISQNYLAQHYHKFKKMELPID